MVLIRRERVRNELLRVLLRHIRMPATAFRMGSLALQDESAPAFVEHLRRAREELLSAHFAIKADADVTGGELPIQWHLAPRDAARALVVERGQQIPRPVCLVLNFSCAVFLHLPRDG